uniref:NADH-ubiquinone oxidoreductase chain 3 n=1 Tax=Cristaria plicata TaxID=165446 RepID=C4PKW4_CRIPL|nr:NADH dehydrogenase subunit 3 [Cristaria plicata]ACQ91002.1 NADH dehydrogenase subunit 3 [Cristaria plicata]ADE08067.1 NADH dehydrogenase subunit 3 [Cristaria plicata]AIM46728.1 NADH dehydrogenase subunit 3 [Cristaria plicata]
MEKVMLSVGLACLLGLILLIVGLFLGMSFYGGREKPSPFECGFDPMGSSRVPFSLRFFLLAVIFVVFDVEIVLLFPVVMVMGSSWMWVSSYLALFIFLILLFGGVVHEWREGSLEWEM